MVNQLSSVQERALTDGLIDSGESSPVQCSPACAVRVYRRLQHTAFLDARCQCANISYAASCTNTDSAGWIYTYHIAARWTRINATHWLLLLLRLLLSVSRGWLYLPTVS